MGDMGFQSHSCLGLLVLAYPLCIYAVAFPQSYGIGIARTTDPLSPSYEVHSLNRTSFPKGFLFGAATSAYQIEGAWNKGGKGPSIWDNFTHTYPEKIRDGSNGDMAVDSYRRYKEDVSIMKQMGLDAYRFSISWSRVLPRGKLSGGVNEEGIKYYNNLINELRANGIEPSITLFHWDLPQALEDEYLGFLSPKIVDDFRDYAELCFKRFGDRVRNWITFNEPWSYSSIGYDSGVFAPGRCSSWVQPNCTGGDSSTEPYLASHHQLLAHAAAVKLYKLKYQQQASHRGMIGIALVSTWMVPFSNRTLDRRAAIRALDFMLGWFMDPLTKGDYPGSMRTLVGNRLPRFSAKESNMVKGSFDFIGLNYYTAFYAAHVATPNNSVNLAYSSDSRVNLTTERFGIPIGEPAGSDWLHVYPEGIWKVLLYIKRKYNNPLIHITENGIDDIDNSTSSVKEALRDNFRIKYYHLHLSFIRKAIENGVNVVGFFAWSIIDNFEWTSGYTVRFGLYYVDFQDGFKRYPKLSAKWFEMFLQG